MHVIQATFADSPPNPYVSPLPDVPIVQAELVDDKPKLGSLSIIAVGFGLLLIGYLSSNVFAIADLYQVGFGPDGEVIPSPFAAFFGDKPAAQWLFYAVCASAAIGGCILIGSQNFNPLVGVIFVMCPLVGLVFLVATPLRIARKYVVPVAAIYLMIGTCLAGVGLLRMIGLYGQAGLNFEPILASLMLQIGLAMLGGAMLKLARTPQEQPAASAA
jgi:hypothetical protein